ncbi:uncharacterized protein PgNI_02835 [Pyricularia grisea]|uniref:Uncharacterized protein n=1 Tax=Pyricularia grisea TaxID=148305 RepID=A0A6P8BEZ7_PYRGI|nr:uncharacterized protein PgNI_02835 [Pyricularia grisea]TLD14360.1 hypothetical protein PgNI_02835 [Pyricularia grisea]
MPSTLITKILHLVALLAIGAPAFALDAAVANDKPALEARADDQFGNSFYQGGGARAGPGGASHGGAPGGASPGRAPGGASHGGAPGGASHGGAPGGAPSGAGSPGAHMPPSRTNGSPGARATPHVPESLGAYDPKRIYRRNNGMGGSPGGAQSGMPGSPGSPGSPRGSGSGRACRARRPHGSGNLQQMNSFQRSNSFSGASSPRGLHRRAIEMGGSPGGAQSGMPGSPGSPGSPRGSGSGRACRARRPHGSGGLQQMNSFQRSQSFSGASSPGRIHRRSFGMGVSPGSPRSGSPSRPGSLHRTGGLQGAPSFGMQRRDLEPRSPPGSGSMNDGPASIDGSPDSLRSGGSQGGPGLQGARGPGGMQPQGAPGSQGAPSPGGMQRRDFAPRSPPSAGSMNDGPASMDGSPDSLRSGGSQGAPGPKGAPSPQGAPSPGGMQPRDLERRMMSGSGNSHGGFGYGGYSQQSTQGHNPFGHGGYSQQGTQGHNSYGYGGYGQHGTQAHNPYGSSNHGFNDYGIPSHQSPGTGFGHQSSGTYGDHGMTGQQGHGPSNRMFGSHSTTSYRHPGGSSAYNSGTYGSFS